MQFKIEITNARRINSPVLRGKFDLQYGGIKILGMLVFAKNGKRWVGFPAQVSEDDEGTKHYAAILKTVTRDSWDKLNRFCLDNTEIEELLKDPPPAVQEALPDMDDDLPEDLPF